MMLMPLIDAFADIYFLASLLSRCAFHFPFSARHDAAILRHFSLIAADASMPSFYYACLRHCLFYAITPCRRHAIILRHYCCCGYHLI